MSHEVVIVGGGLSGLAAAAGLADSGTRVLLLESRPRLGGRAGSFLDAATDEWIDTCQHVSMGCCTNLGYFARLVGIDNLFATQDELLFLGPEGQRCRFRETALPAPLHLLGSFLGLCYLTLMQRLRLCRDVTRLAHRRWKDAADLSFEDWLVRHSRTADLRQHFWDVILVSALSETADRISVPAARKVFVDGFLASRSGWRVQIPRVPLDELYGQQLRDWLTSRGSVIRTLAGVAALEEQDGLIVAARLRSGERIEADEWILAVPWHRIGDLIPNTPVLRPVLDDVEQMEAAPISSVHLWFDRAVLDVPHAVLVGRLSQWVFRRPSQQSLTAPDPDYVQVVISASRDIVSRSHVSIIEEVVGDLAALWPGVREATLTSSRVVTEHRAVFAPQPGVDSLRPDQQSPIRNLQIAGDWTNTGWPATMEGAVKSGFLAAENLLRRRGADPSLVQTELRPGRLARLCLRIGDN